MMRGNVAAAAVQRIARLLFMIGLFVAAYFALCIFDHAARADDGLTDQLQKADPPASIEKIAVRTVTDHAAPKVARQAVVPRKVERRTAAVAKPDVRKA